MGTNSRRRQTGCSRWHKPRLYLTVVAIAQLAALFLAGLFFSVGLKGLHLVDGSGMLAPHGWWVILALPTVAAAAGLLQAHKLGIFISLGVLPMLGFTLGMSVFSMLGESGIEMADKVLIDLSIAAVLAMLGPLLLGWKNMKWKKSRRRAATRRSFGTAALTD
jgi:hypothetical protein